jgi:ribonuclease Z
MSITTSGGIKVSGAWTRAGLGSCVRVEGPNKHDDILFDCGVCAPECLSAGFVFISHGHVDHIGASIMHARGKMLTSRQSIYYVPTESVEPLHEARVAFSKMDGKNIPMNIIAVKPGDIISIGTDITVRVFPTIHRVPSQGYALYKKKRGGLLKQYSTLSGREIGELRKSGERLNEDDTESLEFVYTGDTVFEGLLQPCNHFIFSAAILVLEVTYLDGDRQKAIDRGHIHLADIVENAHLFQNQQIIFVHLSERYAPHGKALNMLREGLPSDMIDRCAVSLRSFGSGEHLTTLCNVDWKKRNAEVGWGWGRHRKPSHIPSHLPSHTPSHLPPNSRTIQSSSSSSYSCIERVDQTFTCKLNESVSGIDRSILIGSRMIHSDSAEQTADVVHNHIESKEFRNNAVMTGRGRGRGAHQIMLSSGGRGRGRGYAGYKGLHKHKGP